MPKDWWFEIGKLVLQLGGGLAVARLTVSWALRRYKSEKMWERQSQALGDVVFAVQEMQRVIDRWGEEDQERRYTEEYSRSLSERYASAKREFERVAAIGQVVLPEDINRIIQTLDKNLNEPREFDWWPDEVTELDGFVSKANSEIIARGRKLVAR